MPDGEVMTLTEVADYLKVAEKTVLRMVHRNELPSVKVGNQWRFLRTVIDEWLRRRMQANGDGALASLPREEPEQGPAPVARLMVPERTVLALTPGTKEAVLSQLAECLRTSGVPGADRGYLEKLMQRERMVSTAIGHGIALPHARHPEDNPVEGPLVVVGRCLPGTDFAAPDGELVYLFFLVLARADVHHVRVMARLARLLNHASVVAQCLKARTTQELLGVFIAREQHC